MKDLDKLFDEVMDELLGADHYTDCALNTSDPNEKKLFSEMAKQEIGHAHNLRDIAQNRLYPKDQPTVKTPSTDPDKCVFNYLKGKWDEYERKINYKLSQVK